MVQYLETIPSFRWDSHFPLPAHNGKKMQTSYFQMDKRYIRYRTYVIKEQNKKYNITKGTSDDMLS